MAETRNAPGRPRSEKAHAAILKAAIAEIRAVGYDAAAMDAIAARAGVGKATVYRRWSSKEALVVDALKQIMVSAQTPDTGSTRGDLLQVMLGTLRMYEDPATLKLLSALVAAMARSHDIARTTRSGFIAARRNTVREVVLRGIARGALRAHSPVDLVIDMLHAPLAYRVLITGEIVDEGLVTDVVDAVMRAFAPVHRTSRGTAP